MTDVVIIDTSGTESWRSITITIVVASEQGSSDVAWVAYSFKCDTRQAGKGITSQKSVA